MSAPVLCQIVPTQRRTALLFGTSDSRSYSSKRPWMVWRRLRVWIAAGGSAKEVAPSPVPLPGPCSTQASRWWWTSGTIMIFIGVACAGLGTLAFTRRDLAGE
jgi:hypothetical protein